MTKFLFEVVVKNDQIYLFRNIKDFSHILFNYFRIYFVENDENKKLSSVKFSFTKGFFTSIAQKLHKKTESNEPK